MRRRRKNLFIAFLIVISIALTGLFIDYSYYNFRLKENFNPIPLNFDPATGTSKYNWKGAEVLIKGGFVKGLEGGGKSQRLLLRAVSPVPEITVKNNGANKSLNIGLENVNPLNTDIGNLGNSRYKIIDSHTIGLILQVKAREERSVSLAPKADPNYSEIIILGDNRDGYDTFANIIQQINFIKPAFVIDNGDLVYGGQPNRYRLFNETVSKLQPPLLTTLGNHDIRRGGRAVYTELYGPAYYSFDYRNYHFIFLDSSRGWTEKRAIPEEQYRWLENDLKAANGKRIFVISHIPSTDPRKYINPNTLPEIPGVKQTSQFVRLLDDYSEYKSLNHGFPDKKEAKRFEALMTKYRVNTVFESHIHSYFSFVKNDVRYVISGGAGAELLTTDSYYHYLRIKLTPKENYLEMVQLPSPKNNILKRYLAAASLFAHAILKEYRSVVIVLSSLIALFLIMILYLQYYKWWPFLKVVAGFTGRVFRFARKEYRKLRKI